MPYIQETCRAGRTIEVRKYRSWRWGVRGSREPWSAPTPEAQQRVNEAQAETKLRRLLNANFETGDYHLVLTYRKGEAPTPEEAKERLAAAIRKMRGAYRDEGNPLKYISVTEYRKARIHHHLIVPKTDLKLLTECWEWGRIHVNPLDESGQWGKLASYLVKETKSCGGKRWNESRNLTRPEIKKEVIHRNWTRKPRPPAGYELDGEPVEGIHEVTGAEYQYYICVKKRSQEHGKCKGLRNLRE